jgi:outer membrane protein W
MLLIIFALIFILHVNLNLIIMKKLFLLIALMGFAVLANAQSTDFHAFKVDLSFGYAIPQSTGGTAADVKAGATVTIEPHYRITDALAVGLRIEGAGLGYENSNEDNATVHVSILTSYCPTLEYYLLGGGFRPFVGAGAGIFSQQTVDYNSETDDSANLVKGGSKFGFFPRAGFEAGHFRLSAEYNILGSNSNYAAFKIGFFFGGGKK